MFIAKEKKWIEEEFEYRSEAKANGTGPKEANKSWNLGHPQISLSYKAEKHILWN